MTGLLFRKIWRDLSLHRGRNALAIAALSIALMAAGVVLAAQEIMSAATRDQFQNSLPVSATLRFDTVNTELLDAIRAMPEVAAVRARRLWSVSVQTEQGELPLQLFAYDNWTDTDIARLQALQGTWPPAPGALVMEQSAQTLLGVSGAGTLSVRRQGQTWSLPVQGVARDVAQAPAWMEHVGYAFARTETLAQLGAEPGFDSVQFRVTDAQATRTDVRRIAARIAALATARGHTLRSVDLPEPGVHIHARQMDSLLLTQGVFGIAAILAAMVLFYYLSTAMLAQEARQIAVLKAIGAPFGSVVQLYLFAAAGQGLIAALLALPVVGFGGQAYGAFRVSMLNFDANATRAPIMTLLTVLLVGVLVPMLAVLWPLRQALMISVVNGLTQSATAPTGRSLRVPGREVLSIPRRWAFDQAFRRPRRTLFGIVGLALGGAIFLAAASVRAAMENAVDYMFRGQRYDVTLSWAAPPSETDILSLSQSVNGVAQAEVWWRQNVSLTANDGLIEPSFTLIGVPTESQLLALPITAGQALNAHLPRGLLVSRALRIAQPELVVGASIVLTDTDDAPWQVLGEFDAGPQALAYAPVATVREQASAKPMLAVQSTERDALAQIDLIQRLNDAFGNRGWPIASSRRPDANRAAIEDHLLMVIDFLRAMGLVMLVVALFSIATLISLGVLERERELAVLRAIGAAPATIRGLVITEALLLGLAGWLLSLLLAWPTSVGLAKAFGQIMFSLPAVGWPPPLALLAWLLVALGVAWLGALWPAWRAERRSVVATLQGVGG